MDLDRLYKFSKSLVMFSLVILILSASVRVWTGKGGNHHGFGNKGCFLKHGVLHGDFDADVFEWESDSGEVNIKVLIEKSGLPKDIEVIIDKHLDESGLDTNQGGKTKVKKKVKVMVLEDE